MYDLILILVICFGIASGLGIAVVVIVCMVGSNRQELDIENLDVEAQNALEVVSPVAIGEISRIPIEPVVAIGEISRIPVEPIVAVGAISRFHIEPIVAVEDFSRPHPVATVNEIFQHENIEEIPRPIRPSLSLSRKNSNLQIPKSRKNSSLQMAVFEEIQKLHPITRQNAIENQTSVDIEEVPRSPSITRQRPYSVLNESDIVDIENGIESRDEYDEEDTVIIMSMVHKYRVQSLNEINNRMPSRKFPVTQSGLLKKSYDYREDIYDR